MFQDALQTATIRESGGKIIIKNSISLKLMLFTDGGFATCQKKVKES